MGIIEKIKRSFLQKDCAGCGKVLVGLQEYVCSDECALKAEEWNAHR